MPRHHHKYYLLVGFLLILIACYGVYLYAQVRRRIEGRVWQLPAAVYSRMVSLEPGMSYSSHDLVTLLEGMQYRQVSYLTHPGEFTVHANSIELRRRSFDFPEGTEGPINVRMTFTSDPAADQKLLQITNQDTQRNFGFFRLDPQLITMLSSPHCEQQRLFLPRSRFPECLVKTLIATEDRYFYQHDGIRLSSICRALLANITAGRAVQGGSTLTQQLVKNLWLTNQRSLWRKANEVYMALILDYLYSKDRILELYLNEVYLGQSGRYQIRGFPLASLYYFGRPVDELSLDQQAMLVGMVKGPSLYNPWRNPQLTIERRNIVLKLLEDQHIIDVDLYRRLCARPLGIQSRVWQPAFLPMVQEELQRILGHHHQDLSGINIFTTIDPLSQKAAEQAVNTKNDRKCAMVVVDRFSGEIRALVGGRAEHTRRGALAKQATYLTKLNTWMADEPIIWMADEPIIKQYVPTVNLGLAVGKNPVNAAPALSLTPMEVAQEFQTIASGGNHATLSLVRSVISASGKVLYQSFPERVVPPQFMQQVVARGTSRTLAVQFPSVAAASSWLAGIDGKEVSLVWVGSDNRTGGAMTIYGRYLANRSL